MMMISQKDISVAFTGHRTYDGQVQTEMMTLLEELYERGYRRFLTGMAWGFDLAAGCAVMQLRQLKEDVKLVAVVPYRDFKTLFRDEDEQLYDAVFDAADEHLVVCQHGGNAAFRMRNDMLVESASLVVAWWDGKPQSGTAYTVRMAKKIGCEVINLHPVELRERQLELF